MRMGTGQDPRLLVSVRGTRRKVVELKGKAEGMLYATHVVKEGRWQGTRKFSRLMVGGGSG